MSKEFDDVLEQAKEAGYDSVQAAVGVVLSDCESPIEMLFILGLFAADIAGDFSIEPQTTPLRTKKRYRVDFALYYPRLPVLLEPLVPMPVAKLAVELDGHDFHEKTKEQARRDKQKDRDLVAQGWIVVRYTGSEIYQQWIEALKDDSYPKFAEEIDSMAHRRWMELSGNR